MLTAPALTLRASLLILLTCTLGALAHEPRELGLLPPPRGDALAFDTPGDAPTSPADAALLVRRLPVLDCRLVLGFVHAPVDGRADTWGYNGVVNEYNTSQGYSDGWQFVTYEFIERPGMHITLDGSPFNMLYLRGGFVGDVHTGVTALDGPGDAPLLARVPAAGRPDEIDFHRITRVRLAQPSEASRVSFFLKDQLLADAQFLNVGETAAWAPARPRVATYAVGPARAEVASLGIDFNRLPADAGEQHPSNFERRFPHESDRVMHDLAAESAGVAPTLAAGQQLHLLSPPLPLATALDGVEVDLQFQGVPAGNLVHLAVQDPITGNRELIRFDLRCDSAGRVRAVLDFPDELMPDQGRVWITLASQHAGTLAAASRVALLSTEPARAREQHLQQRLLLVKGMFYALSEARPFTGPPLAYNMSVQGLLDDRGESWEVQRLRPSMLELMRTLEHVRRIAPDHPLLIGQYHSWLTRNVKGRDWRKELPPFQLTSGVPRWAALVQRTHQACTSIPQWWITHRMTPQGELGGMMQDDTDNFQWWVAPALMNDAFAPAARDVLARAADLVKQRNLREGINVRTTDALHAYEEGLNQLALMPLLFYGDPQAIEDLMIASRSVRKWMVQTPEGHLKWSVETFGYDTAQKPGSEPVAKPDVNAVLMLHAPLMVAWYNGNAQASEMLSRFAAGYGYGQMIVPGGYGGGADINFALYWLTGDSQWLALPADSDAKALDWARREPDFAAWSAEARQRTWWKALAEKRMWELGAVSWAASRSKEALEKSLEDALFGHPWSGGGGAEKFHYIWTAAEQYTDRIFLPVQPVAQPMLGGYSVRNKMWPAYAVSYEGFGDELAALVMEQRRDALNVALINMGDAARTGTLRVWALDPGVYQFTLSRDDNDDQKPDATVSDQQVALQRMEGVTVTLPPRRVMLAQFRQVKPLPPLHSRADLGLAARDVRQVDQQLEVTVHNLGAAAAGPFVVRALDGQGRALAEQRVESLDAPLDLHPRTTQVRLPGAARAARVAVQMLGEQPEITLRNNEVTLTP
jgi:hypothetical protein